MADTAGTPSHSQASFDKFSMQSQAGGQTNFGFPNDPPPAYTPGQQGQFVEQQQQHIVLAQIQPAARNVYTPAPYDYTTQAWLACLCCFWPTGLLAILKASESREALARGDIGGARTAANTARTMIRISAVIGVCSVILIGVVIGVLFGVVFETPGQCCINGYCYDC